jgi:hypothetical protein
MKQPQLSAASEEIDRLLENPWWYWLEYNPKLDSIRVEPAFRAIVTEIKTDMAAQLALVRAKGVEKSPGDK